MRHKKEKSYLGLLFTLIVILAIILTLLVLYSMNPQKMQENMQYLSTKVDEYIAQLKGEPSSLKDDIEFPEEEKLTEAQRHYYYQQLSETGKKIYLTIEKNIDKIKNGEDNIPLPPSLNEDAKSNEGGKDYIANEYQNAWDAFMTDKSEYFYIDSSRVCLVTKMISKGSNTNYEFFIGKGNNSNYFTSNFSSKEEVDQAIISVEKAKKNIVNNASGNNYEKIKYVHDWLVENVKYDTANSKNTSNIYGCLVNGKVVCEGYARAFKYLMDELNIPCVLVSGTAVDENGKTERHAWNYVYIKNNWYAIDVTWDDPIIIGNGKINDKIKYKYFLKGSDFMNKNHTPLGEVTKNGIKFEYPVLSKEDIK
ncbi:MAG: hypothetical protein K6B70_00040 [Clostridia bacterium]|nr:hypothetical protein [Clostridia bacterium]